MPITKRVATSGGSNGASASIGGDQWHGAWGRTWGNAWHYGTQASGASDVAPAIDVTPRVGERPTRNARQRIHHYLEFEDGDYMLLEGDQQETGEDLLVLSCDARDIIASHTRRVTYA